MGFGSNGYILQHPLFKVLSRSCNVKFDESRNYVNTRLYVNSHNDADVNLSEFHESDPTIPEHSYAWTYISKVGVG